MIPHVAKNFMVKWAFVSSRQKRIEKVDKFALYLRRNKNMTVRGLADVNTPEERIEEDKGERYTA